jgi:hypothetical protein
MCMMCEEEFMYRAYLDYLARRAAGEGGPPLTSDEQALLQASGFACDPVPEAEAVPAENPFSRMRPKGS